LYGFSLENGAEIFYDHSATYKNQPIVANHELYAVASDKVIVFENIDTNADDADNLSPQSLILMQNNPNPFNPVTTIAYSISKSSRVDLSIYNISGQKLATLVQEKQSAGTYKVKWDAGDFSSGVYFYRLQNENKFVQTKKLILLK
jgi:hypothetical protein